MNSTRIADVRTDHADITRILSTDDADQLRSDHQLKVEWTPTERVTMLALNALDGPTKDVRVREAIAHAIDRDTLIAALLKGYAKPVNEPLTPASFGFDPDIPAYGYAPDQARALLKQAGLAPGAKMKFLTSPVFDQRVVQALQQMLSDVGIDAGITSVDAPTYLRLRQGRPDEAGDVSYFRWSCGCQDADGTLFPLFHSSSQWAKYRNPEVDQRARGGAQHARREGAACRLPDRARGDPQGCRGGAAVPGRGDVREPPRGAVPADRERSVLPDGYRLEAVRRLGDRARTRRMAMRATSWLAVGCLALVFTPPASRAAPPDQPLRVALEFEPQPLDPATDGSYTNRIVTTTMCDSLIDLSPDLKFIPELATSWEWAPDHLSLTLHLREGVNYQDGTPLDAASIVANLTRDKTAPYSIRKAEMTAIANVEAVDPHTVRVVLSRPYAPLLATLANRPGTPYSPKILGLPQAQIGANPVCAGPFRFKERVAQDHITLERWPGYWNASVIKLPAIIFRTVTDVTVRKTDLQAGALEISDHIGPTDVAAIERRSEASHGETSLARLHADRVQCRQWPRGRHATRP